MAEPAKNKAPRRRPRRVRGVAKDPVAARRKILDSAVQMFGREGFAATTTERIAEDAGYGQATLFFHFKSKAGLLEACLEDALERARASLIAVEHSGTIDLVRALDHSFDDHPTAEFFVRMMTDLGDDSSFRPVYAAFHAHIRDLIDAELRKDTGASAQETYKAAGAILSMMVGVHAEYRLEHDRFNRSDYGDMLLAVVRLILRDLSEAAALKKRPSD
jgi:AcrR family transcriptional regulator